MAHGRVLFFSVCFTDDILLVSTSKKDLKQMIQEEIDAFAAVGLEVGAGKSHWTSYPKVPKQRLKVDGQKIKWEYELVFDGKVVSLSGPCWPAMEYRMTQAQKTFFNGRAYF